MTVEEILYAIFGATGGTGLLAGLIALFKKVYKTYKEEKDKGASTAKAINITVNSLSTKQVKIRKRRKLKTKFKK